MGETVQKGPIAKAPFDQEKLDKCMDTLNKIIGISGKYPGLLEKIDPLASEALRLAVELTKPQPQEEAEQKQKEFAETMARIKTLFAAATAVARMRPEGEESHQVFHKIRPMQFEEPQQGKENSERQQEPEAEKMDKTFEQGDYLFTIVFGVLRSVRSKSEGWEVRDCYDDIHTIVTAGDGKRTKMKTTEIEEIGVRYEIVEGDISQPELKRICNLALEAIKDPRVKARLIAEGAL